MSIRDINQMKLSIIDTDMNRLITRIVDVINNLKEKYPEEKTLNFIIESYEKLNHLITLFNNITKILDKMNYSGRADAFASALHTALDESPYLKLIASCNDHYVREIANIIYKKIKEAGREISFEEVYKTIKPDYSCEEIISETNKLVKKLKEKSGEKK